MFSPNMRERISVIESGRDPTLLRANATDEEVRQMISSPKNYDESEKGKGKGANAAPVKVPIQSMDFEVTESFAWRMHQTRRFYHDIGERWTDGRKTTAWKWVLVIVIGAVVGAMGVLVHELTAALLDFKYKTTLEGFPDASSSGRAAAYFVFVAISVTYALVAAGCCLAEIGAAGSGIPEIKAYVSVSVSM